MTKHYSATLHCGGIVRACCARRQDVWPQATCDAAPRSHAFTCDVPGSGCWSLPPAWAPTASAFTHLLECLQQFQRCGHMWSLSCSCPGKGLLSDARTKQNTRSPKHTQPPHIMDATMTCGVTAAAAPSLAYTPTRAWVRACLHMPYIYVSCNLVHATRSMQPGPCNLVHATMSMQPGPRA